MASSLAHLAENLSSANFDKFREVAKVFAPLGMSLATRKGVYPYEYTDKLEIPSLPDKFQFYSALTETHVCDEDYDHAVRVWNHFGCTSLGAYSNLYLQIDVLLSADIFENFRDICMTTYHLDPAQYFMLPGFSFDCMLKLTKVDLELLDDFEKILFTESGTRGGLVQASKRHASANNPETPGYNAHEPTTSLIYLDDSLFYRVETKDFYDDLAANPNLMRFMDTSNLPSDHKCYSAVRKRIPGLFKNETDSRTVYEFVVLRANSYAYDVEQNVCIRAKGVIHHVIRNHLTFAEHKRCLFADVDDGAESDECDDEFDTNMGKMIAADSALKAVAQIHRIASTPASTPQTPLAHPSHCYSYMPFTPYRENSPQLFPEIYNPAHYTLRVVEPSTLHESLVFNLGQRFPSKSSDSSPTPEQNGKAGERYSWESSLCNSPTVLNLISVRFPSDWDVIQQSSYTKDSGWNHMLHWKKKMTSKFDAEM
ncbi:hypothetical protein QTP88_029001 [Uroleucon formosanum]